MKAIFQGENHISTADKEALNSHLDSDADALFIEGRDDRVSPDNWRFGYLSFLIGALIIFWFQENRDEGPDIKENADIPVHDNIDTDLPELYDRFPNSWKVVCGLVAGLAFSVGVFYNWITVPFITIPATATVILTIIFKPVIVLAAPILYSSGLVHLEEKYLGSRDKDMFDSIVDISESEEYDTIIISCGEAHLNRLPDLFRQDDWVVEINESKHSWISKIWRR